MKTLLKELEELVLQIQDWNDGDRRSLINHDYVELDKTCIVARKKLIKKLLAKLRK